MKKIILICFFSFFGFINSAQAQVNITYAADSMYWPCPDASFPVGFYFLADAAGYTTGDVVTYYIDFGDGIDTTFTNLYFSGSPEVGYAIVHQYAANGTYDVTYAVTMPDLQTDTLVVINELVLGNCNISGNIYVDEISNCIFDGGDIPVQVSVDAFDNITGDYLASATPDVSGYYQLSVPNGIDVKLVTSGWGTTPDFICPSSGEIITTSPSAGNDFAVSPFLAISDAGDSNDLYCFVSPTPVGFYLNAETYGYSPSAVPMIYIDFGDGTTISMADPDFSTTFPYIDFTITHTYLTAGNYDLMYVITMPNLISDTIIVTNEVFLGACETISGYVYHDLNTNCIFDGGDVPVQKLMSAIDLTGSYYLNANSDVNGYYEFILPAGLPMTISLDNVSSGIISCPVSGEIVTSSPSTGNNFALTPGVEIIYITDSTTIYCSNSIDSAYFVLYAETYELSSSDTPTIYTDFGDGSDTTFLDLGFSTNYPYVFVNYSHKYVNPGSYDVTYIITMPGSLADTLIIYNNVIIEPCEIISGYVYEDLNTNCILEGTDTPLYMNVYAQDAITGAFLASAMTDANGYYELYLPTSGTVEISLSSYFSGMLYVCPSSGVITTNAPSTGNDFAVTGNGFDLFPFGWTGFYHPGFTEEISIAAWDLGCLNTPDVQLSVVVTDPLITFVSGEAIGGDLVPDISGDTLTWDIPSAFISGYYSGYTFAPALIMEFTTDVTAVIGTTICFDAIIEPFAGDINPLNNIQPICFQVSNSYDPNYIEVSPRGTSPAGLIDPNLDMVYTIHFQNTGSFPAVNITIKDSLDGNVLDLSSFEYLASSHALTNLLSDGLGGMAFLFDDINLPDSTSDEPNSHGWITYRIKQQPDLIPSTTIENTAHIYFDFNSPIVTNTALNTIKNPLSVDEIEKENVELIIYPVPATDLITVITNSNETVDYQIVDVNGDIAQQGSVTAGDQLSVSSFSNGIYFFKLENGSVEKIVIQK